jgi:hypothetical protein
VAGVVPFSTHVFVLYSVIVSILGSCTDVQKEIDLSASHHLSSLVPDHRSVNCW